ncbi:Pycsar system effector family protein [Novosphingobium sediminis]|uniref:Pycsar system effector family protein n=1 Tax=Novosphingobium sediminis TaxID=707214 RepID=UPI001FE84DDE|nr:Pycsar system effector family protein [Novosphingobium sediminis]
MAALLRRAAGRGISRGRAKLADQSTPEPPKAAPSPLSPSGYSNHAIHLVRTAQTLNLALSQMADSKASLLMGATFVVFTITMGQAKNGHLPAALLVLAAFAFASAMCAVMAVLPSIGRPSRSSQINARPNKLFFGTFTAMDEDEWTESILADLRADETVFRTMLHDMYQNGQVLQHKKYRYLGYAYRLFMAGLTLTVIVFAAEYLLARG